MLQSKTRWKLSENSIDKINLLEKELQASPLVASLLVNRGIDSVESAKAFLQPDQLNFHDPFLLDEMDIAIERIEKAIHQNEHILVFGDYDADGVSSTTVMLTALREKGAVADFYIPNRFSEGYGPNENAFKWAKKEGYSLIITVDTGISALHEAQVAKELGLDLIITDHHEPGPELPAAIAIIHPKKPNSQYPFQELAGVGVAFKVAHALLGEVPTSLLDVVVIGTIADLVPLHGENRLLAKKGITALRETDRPGILALLKKARIEQSELNEETVGFAIAPRINAVGRLESADPAVHLLMTNDAEEALMIADEIDELNKERQRLVSQMTEEAIKEVEEFYHPSTNPVLVIAREGWNAGVIGIVASRLVDRFYRPTIILSIDREKGVAKGSARSIEGFNLYESLSTCRDILPHFGGHPMAAGMTLQLEHVGELRTRLNTIANEVLQPEDFQAITNIDAICSLHDISIESIMQMEQLAPFGMGNPKPKVMIEDLGISSIRKIGSEQNHIKIVFSQDDYTLDSVGFGLGHVYENISPLSKISVVGELSINEWNNSRKPQIMLQDIAINEWQLFDSRGMKNISALLGKIEKDKRRLIAFSADTIDKLNLSNIHDEIIIIEKHEDALMQQFHSDYVVLLDLPQDESLIKTLFNTTFPSRIYSLFYNDQDHFFSTIPTREHFKWFYAFLAKKGPFDISRYSEELAKNRGWSKETIDFMSKVFFELEFVKIDKGFISLSNQPSKRDLTESRTYQLKEKQIKLENKLLYSSYQQLKDWFDLLNKGSLSLEEAVI
ncbi:single-stranded-DNA-specific exonuclease RecJ [Fredinandcohnia quinoae]|uniref:Single-stranded-DNA-specific exonuclease RecJ n=1 Tax=Fredinandcohnia quinoae TaxID=2918902 RepID=A0AAW5E843_9BACI|nr:single-stranded-DNA-specific exonuclease RecJ [Fredinandcohnia sp. SECRCQ15]MCH1627659.1 single-stranded-DNA-specific exonuclease RecJ [Fredinandcohnia sp. SECRCQ15]